ncbi:hypothetical protein P154DRAFT_142306 [Amniculicola lignicola CBS 123094]|uniref:Uncharacterized protein n=1 Tax=Amniculicola lignicola CBS 123094 TaxID=1392246 RepID=A0A6A5WK49_9PLEO|nr:hypothetical protein P154DRAFT_142306 [Amniculicola lignicola CBS 123094]
MGDTTGICVFPFSLLMTFQIRSYISLCPVRNTFIISIEHDRIKEPIRSVFCGAFCEITTEDPKWSLRMWEGGCSGPRFLSMNVIQAGMKLDKRRVKSGVYYRLVVRSLIFYLPPLSQKFRISKKNHALCKCWEQQPVARTLNRTTTCPLRATSLVSLQYNGLTRYAFFSSLSPATSLNIRSEYYTIWIQPS